MLPEAIAIVMAPTDTSRLVFLYHLVIITSNMYEAMQKSADLEQLIAKYFELNIIVGITNHDELKDHSEFSFSLSQMGSTQ